MKINEITKNLKEDAGAGVSGAGSFATSMGGGDGFGWSVFYKQPTKESAPKRKTKTNMRKR